MSRIIMTAALVLALGLTATGCGANNNASTAAHRWNDGAYNAQTQQGLSRGVGQSDGSYYADRDGRVDGYHARSADGSRTGLGNGLTNAGEDLARGAGAAARGVGDAVEDTLDGITGANNSAADNGSNNGTANNAAADTNAGSGINAGNSVNPPIGSNNPRTAAG
ncbi:MAG: hypothetical protein Q4C76_01460 [Bacillota bacterium]|nr:hypothetical protein [Bacillota bacterium]